MPPHHEEPDIRIKRDGSGIVLNWKAVISIVVASVTGTAMWVNLKNDVSGLQQRMDTVSAQIDHQGRMISQINAKLRSPIAVVQNEGK
jgi:cytochrome b subunit of formate dehydrogenase